MKRKTHVYGVPLKRKDSGTYELNLFPVMSRVEKVPHGGEGLGVIGLTCIRGSDEWYRNDGSKRARYEVKLMLNANSVPWLVRVLKDYLKQCLEAKLAKVKSLRVMLKHSAKLELEGDK